jgi:hypothetical protein
MTSFTDQSNQPVKTAEIIRYLELWVENGDSISITTVVTKYKSVQPRNVNSVIACIRSLASGLRWNSRMERFTSKRGHERRLNQIQFKELYRVGWEQYLKKYAHQIAKADSELKVTFPEPLPFLNVTEEAAPVIPPPQKISLPNTELPPREVDNRLIPTRNFETFAAMIEKVDYQELQDIWEHKEVHIGTREQAAKLLSEMRFRAGISVVREPWDVFINVLAIEKFDLSGDASVTFREQDQKSIPTQIPSRSSAVVNRFKRDSEVVRWTLAQANGTCECCNTKAPFEREDGIPYLEVHHLRMLSEGGSDSITNTVAVCPNCHRELHLGKQKDDLLKMLYQKLRRLKIE